jgi:hypothetical protein|tara:strand:+ start:43 stop:177 length:135 start_codon:yes stop_codon:yes gene_type:complete
MAEKIKEKVKIREEEFTELTDSERALTLAIQDLTKQIARLSSNG